MSDSDSYQRNVKRLSSLVGLKLQEVLHALTSYVNFKEVWMLCPPGARGPLYHRISIHYFYYCVVMFDLPSGTTKSLERNYNCVNQHHLFLISFMPIIFSSSRKLLLLVSQLLVKFYNSIANYLVY